MSAGPTNRDLVILLRRRQPGSFDEVYRCYADRIWRFLQRLTGNHALAEDLFQDTWLAAARNVHRLREDTQLLPWLYTIARNKHRNGVRFRMFDEQRQAGLKAETAVASPRPDDQAHARLQMDKVTAGFARLPEIYREVLLLTLVEGLATEQVAQVVGAPESTVRKRLSRARAELAQQIGLDDDPGGAREEE